MSANLGLDLFCASIRKQDYQTFAELAVRDPALVDKVRLDEAIKAMVQERLNFAEEMCQFAEGLTVGKAIPLTNIEARNAVSRAYYDIHHAGRALVLYHERGDPYGHIETIEAICRAVRSVRFLETKFGYDGARLNATLNTFLEMRHLADYHFLGTDSPHAPPQDFVGRGDNGDQICR